MCCWGKKIGSDDEDSTVSVRAIKALGEALTHNEPLEDITLCRKELSDDHILAFAEGIAANQHIRLINIASLSLYILLLSLSFNYAHVCTVNTFTIAGLEALFTALEKNQVTEVDINGLVYSFMIV